MKPTRRPHGIDPVHRTRARRRAMQALYAWQMSGGTPQQVIAHHNATLANISSFGPRTRAVPTDVLIQDGRLALA